MTLTLEERIQRAVTETIELVDYDPAWPARFIEEMANLRRILPPESIGHIEHFGSTAIPGMSAKPIIDMLIEICMPDSSRQIIAPILEQQGYEYFWRTDFDPPYAWFIKRDRKGRRSHHLHLVEPDSPLWQRLYFRDYLIVHDDVAREYQQLKHDLSRQFPNDRENYTRGKGDFIAGVTQKAVAYFQSQKL